MLLDNNVTTETDLQNQTFTTNQEHTPFHLFIDITDFLDSNDNVGELSRTLSIYQSRKSLSTVGLLAISCMEPCIHNTLNQLCTMVLHAL